MAIFMPRLYGLLGGVKPGLHQMQRWLDDQTELPVRCPQGLFYLLWCVPTRKDKTGIAGAFGEGQEFFGRFGSDGNVFNARDAESPIESLDALQETGARDGEHHCSSRALGPSQAWQSKATGMSNEEFGEGHPGPKM